MSTASLGQWCRTVQGHQPQNWQVTKPRKLHQQRLGANWGKCPQDLVAAVWRAGPAHHPFGEFLSVSLSGTNPRTGRTTGNVPGLAALLGVRGCSLAKVSLNHDSRGRSCREWFPGGLSGRCLLWCQQCSGLSVVRDIVTGGVGEYLWFLLAVCSV